MTKNLFADYGLLARAIAVSLLLHVILLLQPGTEPAKAPAIARPRLNARIATGTAARPPLPAVATATPAAPVKPPLPRPTVRHAESAEPSSPQIHSRPQPDARFTKPDAAEAAEAAIPASAPPAESATAGEVRATKATTAAANAALPPSITALDATPNVAEEKKSYLFALAAEARRVKRYPRRAQAAGWAGTAEIGVRVAAGGNAQAPQLRQSSGYADIDNAALSMVDAALKRTPVPESLRQQTFEFVLPVTFSINDE